MSDNEENEQIARAMALSLQGLESQLTQEESEKEQLKEAIAASLGKTVDQLTARDMLMADLGSSTSIPALASAPIEAAIKESIPSLSSLSPAAIAAIKRSRGEEPDAGRLTHKAIKTTSDSNCDNSNKFWNGTVKLTYVKGFVGPDYIKFQDIIQKADLKKALVTAFVCSMEFINSNFPMDVNVCIVTHGRPAMGKQVHSHRIVIQPPLKDEKFGLFHPKLMLLFHSKSMRVVIGSANMERYDYEELENVVFIQDFPLLEQPLQRTSLLPRFARDICDLLDKMQVPVSVKEELLKYDFTKATAQIVASVSGVFEGEDQYNKYGHTRLAEIISDIVGPVDYRNSYPQVEMQTSSLGSLSVFYLNELYQSFCGTTDYTKRKVPLFPKGAIPPIHIIYPSKNTVDSSKLGPSGAGTICLNTSAWKKATFPKQVMCDAISQRAGTLMHSKYIIATLPPSLKDTRSSIQDGKLKGWVYCGSHNATVSAWGKFSIARDSKKPKMNISNWELGVVFPIYEKTAIPAPYKRPPPKYNGKEAWTQDMEW